MKVMYLGGAIPNGLAAIGYLNQVSTGGGWVDSLVDSIKTVEGYQVAYVFFWHGLDCIEIARYQGVTYYVLPLQKLCAADLVYLQKAYESFRPDIIHIFGTEREKTNAMLTIAGNDRCIISITGLVSLCACHYYGGIDSKYLNRPTFNDLVRTMTPRQQQKNFVRLGKCEIASIKAAKYIFGRTTWDYACTNQINPDIRYFHSGEMLRPVFYEHKWNPKKIQLHSIFVSQGTYPLKGLHMLFEALPVLIRRFPDVQVYIAGPDITKQETLLDRIKRTTYGAYLKKLIVQYQLQQHLNFLGPLSAEQMCKQYLSANVFVLPSMIENSSNSLGEAMLLGLPCVASCVGGAQDLIKDREDGFLYPFNEPYMLAHYIGKIFENEQCALSLSKKARNNALKTYDRQGILKETMAAYEIILRSRKEETD